MAQAQPKLLQRPDGYPVEVWSSRAARQPRVAVLPAAARPDLARGSGGTRLRSSCPPRTTPCPDRRPGPAGSRRPLCTVLGCTYLAGRPRRCGSRRLCRRAAPAGRPLGDNKSPGGSRRRSGKALRSVPGTSSSPVATQRDASGGQPRCSGRQPGTQKFPAQIVPSRPAVPQSPSSRQASATQPSPSLSHTWSWRRHSASSHSWGRHCPVCESQLSPSGQLPSRHCTACGRQRPPTSSQNSPAPQPVTVQSRSGLSHSPLRSLQACP